MLTPKEALTVLEQMADRGMGNGADHRLVAEAAAELRRHLNIEPDAPEEEEE